MMLPKHAAIRSRAYLDGARDQSCIRCGRKDGSVVAAHYFGLHRSQLGGGMGHKVDDIYVADLCAQCHEEFDRYQQSNDYERATEFMLLILLTIRRRHQQGLITIKGAK